MGHDAARAFGPGKLVADVHKDLAIGKQTGKKSLMTSNGVLGLIFVAIWFFLWAWLLLGAPSFVRNMDRIFRRQEPSAADLKIAVVGYMRIFFGSVWR
jgi:1,4-dihydroxy-2-naphthoate octaprenyltransferase